MWLCRLKWRYFTLEQSQGVVVQGKGLFGQGDGVLARSPGSPGDLAQESCPFTAGQVLSDGFPGQLSLWPAGSFGFSAEFRVRTFGESDADVGHWDVSQRGVMRGMYAGTNT
jgi:hypothetical protein